MKFVKKFAKNWLPPIVSQWAKMFSKNHSLPFGGDYIAWSDAKQVSLGYDDETILQRVLDSTLKVKRGEAVFERDSVCFHHEEYRWPTLACLLNVASRKSGSLRVLDFGGALGGFYFQHKKFLQGLEQIAWCVVEQKQFVECGRAQIQNDVLRFYESIDACQESEIIDVIFLSSVLQYLERPYEVLKLFAVTKARYLLIDRTPFLSGPLDRLTVQRVPESIYKASYPAWFFSREKFDKEIEGLGYRKITDFSCDELSEMGEFKGIFLERA